MNSQKGSNLVCVNDDDETLSEHSKNEDTKQFCNYYYLVNFGFDVPEFFNDKKPERNALMEKLRLYNEIYRSLDGTEAEMYLINKNNILDYE